MALESDYRKFDISCRRYIDGYKAHSDYRFYFEIFEPLLAWTLSQSEIIAPQPLPIEKGRTTQVNFCSNVEPLNIHTYDGESPYLHVNLAFSIATADSINEIWDVSFSGDVWSKERCLRIRIEGSNFADSNLHCKLSDKNVEETIAYVKDLFQE